MPEGGSCQWCSEITDETDLNECEDCGLLLCSDCYEDHDCESDPEIVID